MGSSQMVRYGGKRSADHVLFLGFGALSELTDEKFRVMGGYTWSKLVSEKVASLGIFIDAHFNAKWTGPFAEGFILSAYRFVKYKSKKESSDESSGPMRLVYLCTEKKLRNQINSQLAQVQAVGEAVQLTRDWSNEPSNFGTPVYYAHEARQCAHRFGLKCKILTEKEAAREKMGLFLGVAKGADREGRIVVLEYVPKVSKKAKTIALVGKGITFDSGGISIKPPARMEEMKHDMTGAATVMGAVVLAARMKIPHRIIAVLVFSENMPDGAAIQPGNVLVARNGKTVEVINTDAEGRLVLADALDFVQDYKPQVVIDVATLTGAVSVALGKHCCGIFGNHPDLVQELIRAGEKKGEKLWQLPLFDSYFEDLKSDCADMKNSANDTHGGAIRGAIFLKQFIRKKVLWAHLDIASTAYNVSHLSYFPKRGASGAYVRTLAQFLADYK
jgi:leucyl aminopeptidase